MTKELILASGSPRRKELLEKSGFVFSIEPSTYEEDMTMKMTPDQLVQVLALGKAQDIAEKHSGDNSIILGADSIVVYDGDVIGKPVDAQDAKKTLRKLSGNTNSAFTGVVLIDATTGDQISFSVESQIAFNELSDEQIDSYVATGVPLGKAGSYAIQDIPEGFLQGIEGSRTNVMGLPIDEVSVKLKELGVEVASK